jgi:predicted sulfurtransferase
MMRKSTEFPLWLDRKETKEKLKGKQVLMYCTGGVRCERASALLKFKMEKDPEIKELGIKGVFQLQGGIDKYFKEFPEGGFWSGRSYTFDKRFAHAPPKIDGELHSKKVDDVDVKGKCEACSQPWDKYRGKRRCPTCGVPSLICKDCFMKE